MAAIIPKRDEEFLKEKGFDYTLKEEGSDVLVMIKNWSFPPAYNPRSAEVLIRLLSGYPLTKVDMFWTIPDVLLASNGAWPLNCQVHETYDGRSWQRWSRHTPEWREGIDNLRTFITAMAAEINRGI